MKRLLTLVIFAVAIFLLVRNCGKDPEVKPTKNLILMIPDGTSTGMLSLARWYNQYMDPVENLADNCLAIDPYICGLARTYSSDSPIAESSGAMTAIMTGMESQGSNLCVYPKANPPQDLVRIDMSKQYQPMATLLEAAKIQQGKATGAVVTCVYTQATPAGTASHVVYRGNYSDISYQMASQGLDVLFGGGTGVLDNKAERILEEQGITCYKDDIDGFRAHKEGKVWALFDKEDMAFDFDRKEDQPSLTEMSLKAIDLLSKNKKGFFLMIEGSLVDYGGHANDPSAMISEYLAFDKAVKAVMDFAKKDGNTTIVIMPDHGCGGVQIGEYGYKRYTKNGLDSLFFKFKDIKATSFGLEAMLTKCQIEEIPGIFKQHTGIDLKEKDLQAIIAHRTLKASDHMAYGLERNLIAEIAKILRKYTHVGFSSSGHTGEDVFLAVYNPNDQRPEGFMLSTDVNRYMRKVLGLKEELEDMSDRLFAPHYEVFKDYDYTVSTEDGEAVLTVTCQDKTIEVKSNRSFIVVNGEVKELGSVVPYIRENKTFYLPAATRDLLPKVKPAPHNDIPVYAWCSVRNGDTQETFKAYLQGLKDKGVTGVCVNSSLRDREKIAMASKAAHEVGLVYHAWLPSMLQGGMPHSWYAVNALGKSADTDPVYVDYYKALDPHNPEVIDWLVKQYTEIAQLPDVDYVQLDYIRYPDAILARGLWAKYGLDMTTYYAPADYCYCDSCRRDFEATYGRPVKKRPYYDDQWAQFRNDIITNLVNKIAESVHAVGKKVSADVFPGPDSYAEPMVHQQWDKWEIDEFFPMNYNDFYLTDTKWVAVVTGEEVRAVPGKPVYSGLFICHDWQNKANLVDPENSGLIPSEVEPAVLGAMNTGAAGICLFTPDSMTEEHWKALDKAKAAWLD